MTTDPSAATGIDAAFLDRMTDTFVILQAKSACVDRGKMIAALQAIRRQLPADAQLLLVEGESDVHIVREYLLAIERTSLGARGARRARTRATAGKVADILIRHRESVDAGPLGLPAPQQSGQPTVRTATIVPDADGNRARTEAAMNFRPIETRYAGRRFRSRLEARWAVFFKHLGIPWEYEPQGYVIDGRPYLPDFKLLLPGPSIVFAEVKNVEVDPLDGEHVELCRGLARATDAPVILLTGEPHWRPYNQVRPGSAPNEFLAVFFRDYDPKIQVADGYWWQQITVDEQTGMLQFPHDERAAAASFGRGLVQAVEAARSARFEHGAGR
jgi:hypothetical protein